MKVVVSFKLKNIYQCLHKLYLEYISIGVHKKKNDDREPPAKISRHPLNTYIIGPPRTGETSTTEQLSVLNADKTKMFNEKAITKYEKFVNITLPIIPVYKDLIGSH